jgi:hypothetical protein
LPQTKIFPCGKTKLEPKFAVMVGEGNLGVAAVQLAFGVFEFALKYPNHLRVVFGKNKYYNAGAKRLRNF